MKLFSDCQEVATKSYKVPDRMKDKTIIPSLNYPKFLQRLRWIFDPVGYMESAAKQFPDIFDAEILGFGGNLIFVQDPRANQKVLTNDRKIFKAPGEQNKTLTPLLGDVSVIMADGEIHKRKRKLLMPPFHGERMPVYGQLIGELTEKVINALPLGQVFEARSAMQEISLQVILEAVFGLHEGEHSEKLKRVIGNMCQLFRSPFTSAFLLLPWLQKDLGAWSPWGDFVHQRSELDKLLYQEIAERREQDLSDRTDILSLLMLARDEDGNPMTDKELRDELMTLLFAGHETTATALAWGLYWIHSLPEVKNKLLQEIDSLGENPDPMEISNLPYLTAFCKETLRIYPVGMLTFPRVVQEPVELSGYELTPGKVIVNCIYLTHHREDLYPEPKKFKPERFLEKQFSPYEFMPFGGGVRRCVGDALAMLELKLVLATIMSKYELTLADNKPEKPARRGLTLAPTNGVKTILKGKRVREAKQATLAGIS